MIGPLKDTHQMKARRQMLLGSKLASWIKMGNRRVSRRVATDIKGKLFIISEKREFDCEVINWSSEGVGILCHPAPASGTRVMLSVADLGRFEGTTIGPTDDATGIRFEATASERKRIAERFNLFLREQMSRRAIKGG
jgi:hypothetical protein